MAYTAGSDPRRGDGSVRERIIATAYDLFCHNGVRAIGVDRIVTEAGVAKMSLYKHFRSKDDLVLAVLERREELWTQGWLQHELERHGGPATERLLAIFDLFDEWFGIWWRSGDYEGCFFINALLESHGPTNPVGEWCLPRMENARLLLVGLAEEAGVQDPETLASQWFMLMSGSIVAAYRRDELAAKRARDVASLLLEREQLG